MPSDFIVVMVYYQISPKVLFRNYGDFGYLTDNRNFGYKFSGNDFVLGDQIVSEEGADILSCLEKKPLSLEEILLRMTSLYSKEDVYASQNDIVHFLGLLCSKGFVFCGYTPEECVANILSHPQDPRTITSCDFAKEKFGAISTQDFFAKRFGDSPFPTSIHVEIVSECNERCIHCFIPHELKTDLMDEGLFYRILDQAKELNLLHITISGGEPMLHPRFVNFVKKCREYDMSVNVLSNLTLLDEKMISEMKKNPLLSVQTSVYSMHPDVHDGITRHQNSLAKTCASVRKLVESGIPTQISCPIIGANYDTYKSVEEWAADLGISVGFDYSIIAKYNHNKDNLGCRLSYEKLDEYITEKVNCDTSYLEDLKKTIADNRQKSISDYICSVCSSSLCIGPNGNVFPCVGWSDRVVGNLNQSSLFDIWYKSSEVKKLRSIRRQDIAECISCDQKDYCTICMVRNSNESPTGNPLEVSKYFCAIAKLNKTRYEAKSKLQ